MSQKRARTARQEAAKAKTYLEREFDKKNAGMPVTLWRRITWIFWPPKRKKDLKLWVEKSEAVKKQWVELALRKLGKEANTLMAGGR